MVEIDRSTLSAQIVLAPQDVGSGGVVVDMDSPIVGISTSQSEVVLFQTDATPLPDFVGTVSSPVGGIVDSDAGNHSVPLNGLQETNDKLSENVPVFTESLSIEMTKRRGKAHDSEGQANRRKLKKIKREVGIAPGTKVEEVYIPGRGKVPCIIKGGKATPI